MKHCIFALFLLAIHTACAQFDLDEALYWVRQKGVHTISLTYNANNYHEFTTEEWEFSRTGKLVAFRTYISKEDPNDPYPVLPDTVLQSPEDSTCFTDNRGKPQARALNYCFRNPFGIWQRSYYLDRVDYGPYNEMQYAFDGDSNLIYYRSQMDYIRPLSYHYLQSAQYYDTLGNVTESFTYDMMICEPCASWYPGFEMFSHEQTVYDYANGTAHRRETERNEHIWQFDQDVVHKYFFSPCIECVLNEWRRQERTVEETFEIPIDYVPSRREQRKIERAYAENPTFFFEGDSLKVTTFAERKFSVEYW